MNRHSLFRGANAFVLSLLTGVVGCAHRSSEAPPPPVPVTVSRPIECEVTDYMDFTGRTDAVDSVEVRAHVWGYLDRVNFKEGALVKKGDILFKIDPRPYRAVYDSAVAQIKLNEAQMKQAIADNARAHELAKTPWAISKQDLDKYAATEATAEASVAAASANAESARLNLEFTDVISPISGRVSRFVVTVGNLVQAGDQSGGTLLTTIVSTDPMYAVKLVHAVKQLRK